MSSLAPTDILALSEKGMEMQRDMDLVRKIMLEVQSRGDVFPRTVKIDDVDDEMLGRHVEMLPQDSWMDRKCRVSHVATILCLLQTYHGRDMIS
jgi:hypothetical protein